MQLVSNIVYYDSQQEWKPYIKLLSRLTETIATSREFDEQQKQDIANAYLEAKQKIVIKMCEFSNSHFDTVILVNARIHLIWGSLDPPSRV